MSSKTTVHRSKKRHWREHLLITIFSFVCLALLSIFVLNFSLFNPFVVAFKDFSLSDIYYSKLQDKNRIYSGPLVMVNVEDRGRGDIAFLLQRIHEGAPKVVGLDIIFPDRKDSTDDLLKEAFATIPNLVLPYAAQFDQKDSVIENNKYFATRSEAYVNLIGEQKEFSTIRYYYPFFKGQPAFTTLLLQKFNPVLAKPLEKKQGEKTDIRFWGNLQNFRYFNFDEVMDPAFDVNQFKNKIVLMGYLGQQNGGHPSTLDEDRFYTPVNKQMAGRSHPDMYGLVVHANILRMALDKDYLTKVPAWLNWTFAFLICWLLVPLFSYWYVHKAMWSHFFTKLVQLAVSILFMYITVLLYAKGNLKIESASILVSVLLLGDFILFYDGFVKFLRLKLGAKFHSLFFEGHGH